ncbi:MAG: phenylacetate-CoA oxygenase subunit PaaI [Burkholderiales bacterium]|nr:phenylacetate-CoA oxygenase subunit PaaI [Burkholderiales bacterium]
MSAVLNNQQEDSNVRIDALPAIDYDSIPLADPPRDVEILAQPRQFKLGDALPDEYRDLLVKLIYNHAEILDSKPYRDMIDSQWEVAKREAPTLKDLAMMARFNYEEFNHGYIFSNLLRGMGAKFEKFELRQYLFEHPKQTWLDLAIHHFLASKVGVMQAAEWMDSSYAPLADVVPRVFREERGHAGMGYMHLAEIVRDPAGKAQAQEKLKVWWPMALDMFGNTDSQRNKRYRAWGLKVHTNGQLRDAFIANTVPQIEALGLTVPDHNANRRYH